MNKRIISLVFGVMCMILTMSIIVQYKTIKNANKIVGDNANSELKAEILRWKEKYESSYNQLAKAEEKLEKQRKISTQNDDESENIQKQLKTLNSLIGTVDVKGKGVIITLEDNKNVTSETVSILDNISNYLVHDMDLIRMVNELKNAGAEAISINEQRIINSSAITCDGNVVLVNGNKISSPFVIKAIGSQETILGAIQRPGGLLEKELSKYGLVKKIEMQNNISIYRYNGIID